MDFEPREIITAEMQRRIELYEKWREEPNELQQLVLSADQFLVKNPTPLPPPRARGGEALNSEVNINQPGVGFTPNGLLAGYHWFEEWGRDTMISLPGLTLVTGKFGVAKQILRAYVSHMNQGLIPNRIPNAEEKPHYNTADATLWLFWAVSKYLAYTKDREFLEELLPKLLESIEWHVRGTYYEIGMDEEDGLLRAGDAGTQLTWMDAKVSDWVVTPRHGKPVEINALWQHALQFLEEFGAQHAGPAASEVAARFNERFWNEETGYLNDVVDGAAIFDSSLRPNQVIALSLPSPLLDPDKARRALAAVERDLLTPYGLRTLSPHDPRYKGRYEGDQWHRDGAYHQGTVWPWLLGPFITVAIKYAPNKEAARKHYREYLQPLWRHLQKAGLGSISEIFDGDAPHTPRGCIAQAWSVAEVLRVLAEELKES